MQINLSLSKCPHTHIFSCHQQHIFSLMCPCAAVRLTIMSSWSFVSPSFPICSTRSSLRERQHENNRTGEGHESHDQSTIINKIRRRQRVLSSLLPYNLRDPLSLYTREGEMLPSFSESLLRGHSQMMSAIILGFFTP